MENNAGFAFYRDFYEAVEKLPIEQQQEIFYCEVKYGITGELPDPAKMPIGYAFVIQNKKSIDGSVDRWNSNVEKASMKADAAVKSQLDFEAAVEELMRGGKKVTSIALAAIMGVSDSTVRKRAEWKQKDEICERVSQKIRERSQNWNENQYENSQENVNLEREIHVKERENVRENCENSQLLGAASDF